MRSNPFRVELTIHLTARPSGLHPWAPRKSPGQLRIEQNGMEQLSHASGSAGHPHTYHASRAACARTRHRTCPALRALPSARASVPARCARDWQMPVGAARIGARFSPPRPSAELDRRLEPTGRARARSRVFE
ncbi:hypothetical protein WOLCODRAFT_162908 [Wolfiporia cocos MD-104 SS10]|uniref:Uncharacterized protein n=1 Tax=Wolfiporia cocos (strain MD-104) TaxID=742152 RepID=A0A2H3JMU5_WOLCO|nr:hypothetical protein WOLCODRAFT_162908 [Wolfiporia cocos MD-104 SS10]